MSKTIQYKRKNKRKEIQEKEKKERKQEIRYCNICGIEEMKYICPNCTLGYCSVSCCKKHKETCKPQIDKQKEIMKPKRSRSYETHYLSDTMKQSLLQNDRLNEILSLPRCRELLRIVQEEGKETLHSLMYGNTIDDIIFQNFALRVLQCLGLRDEYGTGIL